MKLYKITLSDRTRINISKMEANLEEIVLDDSIVVVQEGPAEKEDNGNATITLDDTLESLESTDSKQWDKEQKQRKEENKPRQF